MYGAFVPMPFHKHYWSLWLILRRSRRLWVTAGLGGSCARRKPKQAFCDPREIYFLQPGRPDFL